MEKKRNTIIIIIIFIVALLMGISYAYFSARITGTSKVIKVDVDDLELTYNNGNSISLSTIGSQSSKTITIQNTGNQEITYDLIWENLNNTFINKDDVVYSITCSTSVVDGTNCKSLTETEIPISGYNIPIIENITIAVGETQTFIILYKSLNTSLEQSINMGCELKGRIFIKTTDYTPEYIYLEPKNLVTTTGQNYLSATLLQNNTLVTTPATLNKVPVTAETYETLPDSNYTSSDVTIAGKNNSVIENGLYKANGDDGYYTYYFRGVVNNYIKIGDFDARIIRINENGTIRVVLYIEDSSSNKYRDALLSVWNSQTANNSYQYIVNDVTYDSTAKLTLDSFNNTYIASLYPVLDYSVYCNDKSLYYFPTETAEDLENSLYTLENITIEYIEAMLDDASVSYNPESYYNNRRDYIIQLLYLVLEVDPTEATESELLSEIFPVFNNTEYRTEYSAFSFTCSNTEDKYIYKIGLATVDELGFSGINADYVSADGDSILWNEYTYTMSPYSSTRMFLYHPVIGLSGISIINNEISILNYNGPMAAYLQPVLNLKSDVKITGGTGTSSDPYIVDLNS